MARITDEANELMNAIIEYVCCAYQVDYNGLADMIGMNRGWFTRYRNAEFDQKGFNTTCALIRLATGVTDEQITSVLFDE